MTAPAAASADVAALIPERVSDPGGDFTAETNPTQAQVMGIIDSIVNEVQASTGPNIDTSIASLATLVVATGAAAQVELGFTNDLAKDQTSKYEILYKQYRDRLGVLAKAQVAINQGAAPGTVDPQLAQYTFPDSPITRWATRF